MVVTVYMISSNLLGSQVLPGEQIKLEHNKHGTHANAHGHLERVQRAIGLKVTTRIEQSIYGSRMYEMNSYRC